MQANLDNEYEDNNIEDSDIKYWQEVEEQIFQAQELCGPIINYKKV
jgi:hypothetical protein